MRKKKSRYGRWMFVLMVALIAYLAFQAAPVVQAQFVNAHDQIDYGSSRIFQIDVTLPVFGDTHMTVQELKSHKIVIIAMPYGNEDNTHIYDVGYVQSNDQLTLTLTVQDVDNDGIQDYILQADGANMPAITIYGKSDGTLSKYPS